MQTHENFERKHEAKASSERTFGLVFAAFCALAAGLRFWHGRADAPWWLAAGAVFALLALFWTAPLAPLNRLWTRLGDFLHAISAPLLMALIFAVAIVPTGLLVRLLGKDPLRLRRDPSLATYWIARGPGGPGADAMKNQF